MSRYSAIHLKRDPVFWTPTTRYNGILLYLNEAVKANQEIYDDFKVKENPLFSMVYTKNIPVLQSLCHIPFPIRRNRFHFNC